MLQRAKLSGRQHAGPGVEDLHRVGAGFELLDEIARRHLDQNIDHARECFRLAIRKHARGRLVRRAASRHHVGRDRPRRAAETEQRDLRRQRRLHAPHRLIHRCEYGLVRLARQRAKLGGIVERREPRAFARLERHLAAERVRHDQNVGKENRGVEAKAPDRLQGHFGRPFGREAQVEEASRFRAQRAIFGQIAPGLAHEPHRRCGLAAAGEDVEDRLYVGQRDVPEGP